MSPTKATRKPTRDSLDVVLVIVGALGDLCVRRVLQQAREFAAGTNARVQDVVLIDRHRREQVHSWIARRLIEQRIEKADRERIENDKTAESWLATGQPRVPDSTVNNMTVEEALGTLKNSFSFSETDIAELKTNLETSSKWALAPLSESTFDMPMPRYWQSISQDSLTYLADESRNEITGTEVRVLSQRFRLIVYVATPPQAYLGIIRQWAEYADRIALEKPICGLLEEADGILKLAGREAIIHTEINTMIQETARKRADRNLAPLEVLTIDHYNGKWITLAIDVAKGRHIGEHILKRPTKIVVEICETDLLPPGRFYFYNAVGGAFADMAAHLMQPLRAISPYASVAQMLANLHVVGVRRSQYRGMHTQSSDRPNPYRGKYLKETAVQHLLADTETYAEVELKFISGDWINVPVVLRTGKGISPRSKFLRVYGPDEGEGYQVATFDIENDEIRLGIEKDGILTEYEKSKPFPISLVDSERYVGAREYRELFADLCKWHMPDPRYFPPVREAVRVCEFVRKAMVKERHRGEMGLPPYDPYGSRPRFGPPQSVPSRGAGTTQPRPPSDDNGSKLSDDADVMAALENAARILKQAEKTLMSSNASLEQITQRIVETFGEE